MKTEHSNPTTGEWTTRGIVDTPVPHIRITPEEREQIIQQLAAERERISHAWLKAENGTIQQLREQLAAAMKDTKRMDFLEKHFRIHFGHIIPIRKELDKLSPTGAKTKLIREAIDAALAKIGWKQ